jgi:hypothetical protein
MIEASPLIPVVDHDVGGSTAAHGHVRGVGDESVRWCADMNQPTIRLNTSRTVAREQEPGPGRHLVMSPTQRWSGWLAVKLRANKSGAAPAGHRARRAPIVDPGQGSTTDICFSG